jgi:hypothetical protein
LVRNDFWSGEFDNDAGPCPACPGDSGPSAFSPRAGAVLDAGQVGLARSRLAKVRLAKSDAIERSFAAVPVAAAVGAPRDVAASMEGAEERAIAAASGARPI